MADDRYKAWGYAGTQDRPKLQEDLDAMTDEEKRRRAEENAAPRLREAFTPDETPAMSATPAEIHAIVGNADRARGAALRAQADEMLAKANEIDRSGTGNMRAGATYRYIAAKLLDAAIAAEQGQAAPSRAITQEQMPTEVRTPGL